MNLGSLRAFILDLDGCVYTGNTLVPGVQTFLRMLRGLWRPGRPSWPSTLTPAYRQREASSTPDAVPW